MPAIRSQLDRAAPLPGRHKAGAGRATHRASRTPNGRLCPIRRPYRHVKATPTVAFHGRHCRHRRHRGTDDHTAVCVFDAACVPADRAERSRLCLVNSGIDTACMRHLAAFVAAPGYTGARVTQRR